VKAILKSVSRSFHLTISFLPRPLREPVSLAYLLARATDTIAFYDAAGARGATVVVPPTKTQGYLDGRGGRALAIARSRR
jgi:farnesyl-diphosphate farnesyltransferase